MNMMRKQWSLCASVTIVLMMMIVLSTMNVRALESTKVTSRLHDQLSKRSTGSSATNIWVFFNDKPNINVASRSLDEITVAARERRRKVNKENAVDFTETDAPVDESYIQGVVGVLEQKENRIRTRSKWLNAISVLDVTSAEVERVAALQYVKQVEIVSKFIRPSTPASESSAELALVQERSMRVDEISYGRTGQQITQINADQAHRLGYNGTGITILILDSGFRVTHRALQHLEVVDQFDFVKNDTVVDNQSGDQPSQFHHGTQCLSLIAAQDPDEYYGVAFGAKFLLAKTEDVATETSVEEDNFVRAIEWGEARGADLLSASLGYTVPMYPDASSFDGKTAVTTRAVNIAIAHGLTCVVAAGNDGPSSSSVSTPGDAFESITVGAVDSDGGIARFSSRGPTFDARIKPEICARGASAYVVEPSSQDNYRTGSGTSFATPIVAGAVALMLSANKNWTPAEIRKAILSTGSNALSPDNSYGWGILDVMASINYASKVKSPQCNNNGYYHKDRCICYSDHAGPDCYDEYKCDEKCVNGFCKNNLCECFSGFTGTNCSQLQIPNSAQSLSSNIISWLLIVVVALVTLVL